MHIFQKLFFIAVTFFFFYSASAQTDTTQQIVPGRFNSREQRQKPYVILISADGFRYDLADKYHTTNLIRLRSEGVQAEYMTASYPTLTFPNHYTLVTGMYPTHHGIVDNSFYNEHRKITYRAGDSNTVTDSSWYGGVPLWVLAEQQQMITASFYWVGSEAAILGIRPTYYYHYNEKINIDERINVVKQWLQLPEEKRPHLITFYFPEPDHTEHAYGVDSRETEEAVHFVDENVGKLVDVIGSLDLPVNFIFVSDHGMADIDTGHILNLPSAIDTSKFIIPNGNALLHLYAKNKNDVSPVYQNLKAQAKDFDVYLAGTLPAGWHYSKTDDRYNRAGDIILVPKFPKVFQVSARKPPVATHGFDNMITEMRATFYAWGPNFKQYKTISGFENIHIYPLVAEILKLKYSHTVDGKLKVLKPVLK